jgi:hypothetical protein
MWQGTSPGAYDATADATANSAIKELADPSASRTEVRG